ncbi:ubiquitin carboxyl hydrolase family protein [Trichuris trichiura]|uniref:ubiquitinyl hydrolase 1 n=1 Tax=Trichuris trichiura TaxID=36087 RepID=A0A077YV30_TRITR|nr:ubiquitin carboxyl hydrolase family protein [Trichuris trichiura]
MIDHSYIFIVGGISAASFMVLAVYFYLDTKRNYIYDVPGLHNMGATCFVNALLQGLASCKCFVGWTYRFMFYRHCIFLQSLAEILQKLNESTGETLSAARVVNALRRRGWILESYSQQDVHELLNVFCSTWSEELTVLKNAKASMQAIVSIFQRNISPQHSNFQLNNLSQVNNENSNELTASEFPISPCEGLINVQNECLTCGNKMVTLEECLESFLEREMVDDVACEFCSQDSNSTETRTSRSRTLWLDTIPLELYLLKGDSSSTNDVTGKQLYRLQAVIVHQGSVSSGHFVTYRRGIIDERYWVSLSDATVSPIGFEKVSLCQAYMVFYERDVDAFSTENSDSGPPANSFA